MGRFGFTLALARRNNFLPKVKSVAPELKVEVNELISAANMTAINMPLKPAGKSLKTKVGYAIFEQAIELSHTSVQTSSVTQATSSVNKIRDIIPGIMIRNIGVILIKPAITHPNLAFDKSFAANVL